MANGTRRGLDLFRILGVQVALDYSWFVVFLLVAWSLGAGYFPQAYPGHASASYAIVGLGATFLFFASVLAHELSHAAVANWLGDEVRRITLFIFGGMAELSREPRSPRAESLIAAVGPLTSLALAGTFWIVFTATARVGGDAMWRGVLRHLAFVNLALGLFNLLPGFPLDGGRLLRAFLWRRLGSLPVATARAADWGVGIAGGLMFLGAAQIFLGGLVGGLWLIFVGMFLRGAARGGYHAMVVEAALDRRRVAEIRSPRPCASIQTRRWRMRSRTTSCVTGTLGFRCAVRRGSRGSCRSRTCAAARPKSGRDAACVR